MKKNTLTVNYENIPISDDTIKGLSWNIYDQQFLKRVLDRQDEVIQKYISNIYDEHATIIIDEVRKMLNEIKLDIKAIHIELKDIQVDLKNINNEIIDLKKDILDHEWRIGRIEKKLEI